MPQRLPVEIVETESKPRSAALPSPIAAQAPQSSARLQADLELSKLFDGAARRRRVAWTFAALALTVVSAALVASIASQFRPI